MVKEHADEDAELPNLGGVIRLAPAIAETEKIQPILKRNILGVA